MQAIPPSPPHGPSSSRYPVQAEKAFIHAAMDRSGPGAHPKRQGRWL